MRTMRAHVELDLPIQPLTPEYLRVQHIECCEKILKALGMKLPKKS
jgi:hypothetical protein